MQGLADRLADVRIAAGDWRRVLGPAVTTGNGVTAVYLDPPYEMEGRSKVYVDEKNIYPEVRAWAFEHGADPNLRIAISGYEDFKQIPLGWTKTAWKTRGGYGSKGNGRGLDNAAREVIYYSPGCIVVASQGALF